MKTFEPNKSAKELGIDITRKFVVAKEAGFSTNTRKGDILTLIVDDGTECPFFSAKRTEKSEPHCCDWSSLAYYTPEKNWDTLEVDDEVLDSNKCKRYLLARNGRMLFFSGANNKDEYGWTNTKEYFIEKGWTIKPETCSTHNKEIK